jgi:rhodanese-related sulfurtransferase
MKSLALSLVSLAAVALIALTAGAACSRHDHAAIPTVTIGELDTLLARGAATPVDANGPVTRQHKGVIPGAIRLTDYETFTAAELPADRARPLVFYCANEQCGASHTAAERARAQGHRDVRVLPAGILGWAAAGKRVEPGA